MNQGGPLDNRIVIVGFIMRDDIYLWHDNASPPGPARDIDHLEYRVLLYNAGEHIICFINTIGAPPIQRSPAVLYTKKA